MKITKKDRLVQAFSKFLKEQGTYEETTTSSQLDGLLDPDNNKISLSRLSRAASAVGCKLTFELPETHIDKAEQN